MPGGRKGFGEELQIVKRYADLSDKFFAVLNEFLNSEDKADQKWAVEQLSKAYPKMIPQDITSGGEKITVPIYGGTTISKCNGDEKGIRPEEED